MGRVKLQIKKIENTTNRQVTFSKRRNGLVKKAYELCILCDIDIALIMFSPSGRVSHFSGRKSRVEDVIARFIDVPDQEFKSAVQNREFVISTLKKLREEDDIHLQQAKPSASPSSSSNSNLDGGSGPNAIELQMEIKFLQEQIKMAEEQLRMFEPGPATLTSMGEIESCEKNLIDTLARVTQRKKFLTGSNQVPNYDPSTSVQMFPDNASDQGLPASFDSDVISWLTENNNNNINNNNTGGGQHQYQNNQMFSTSDPSSSTNNAMMNQLNHSPVTTMYDPLSYGGATNINFDPTTTISGINNGEFHQLRNNNNNNLSSHDNSGLPPWHHQAFTPSSELLSALMQCGGGTSGGASGSLSSFMKHELDQLRAVDASPLPPSMMMTYQQVVDQATVLPPVDSCPTEQCSEEGSSTYESQIPPQQQQVNIVDNMFD